MAPSLRRVRGVVGVRAVASLISMDFFFFSSRRRHTRLQGDWSSDVCSSDLEIAATRRYAFYAPRRPDGLTPAERWFAETGTVVLASDDATAAPDDASLAAAFVDLARDSGWRFGQIAALGPALGVWRTMADALGAPLVTRSGFDPAACPLVVAQRPQPADSGWSRLTAAR